MLRRVPAAALAPPALMRGASSCLRQQRRHLVGSGGINNDATSAEWAAAGLGIVHADPSTETMNRLMFVQVGFGVDQHGDRSLGSTKAAIRTIRDAISFNSIPGMVHACRGEENMLIHVKLGLPEAYSFVDLDLLANAFPYGRLLPIEVAPGGFTFGCGRVVPELGDEDDTATAAVAAALLGYHDHSDTSTTPRAWDTRDGH